jgi:transcriptional regulator with XRE-family HTH domain
MSTVNNIVGNNIRRVRMGRNLTQTDLGEMLGRNQRTISNWEKGLRDPGSDNIRSIADALDISPTELIGHNSAPDDTSFQSIAKEDDMYPEIQHSDTLTVCRSTEVKDGDIIMVKIDGTDHFRRIFSHDGLITLISSDPKIGMRVYDSSEVTIIGKVTKIERILK